MALTNAQLREHAGRIFLRGMDGLIGTDKTAVTVQEIAIWVKDHMTDSAFSTVPDRREAVGIIFRQLFQRTTGMDPIANRRIFRKWLDGMIEYGYGITIESQGA